MHTDSFRDEDFPKHLKVSLLLLYHGHTQRHYWDSCLRHKQLESNPARTSAPFNKYFPCDFCHCQRLFSLDLDPDPRRGVLSATNTASLLVRLLCTLVGAVLVAVSCFFVLPLLSSALWLRGLLQ